MSAADGWPVVLRFSGGYAEYPCNSCGAMLTSQRVPVQEERFCADCLPTPPPSDRPSDAPGPRMSPVDMAEFWALRGRAALDLGQIDDARVAYENVAIYLEIALADERRRVR